ncbi:hypothetical protein PR002_g14008 [Phytophthora rubi]|uniref:Uncharacterized protein n=1 Tax=Phytophthora rubi TaxID=129364 RepID=A0A6A3LB77_9STRA|nr:hypothetical protein PR002_g14008 [Phytophthora rubi]
MEDTSGLRRELQQLSPAQLRELLSASGHGQLLREEKAEEKADVDAQLMAAVKDEGNAFFRQGRMKDAVTAYSRCIAIDPNNAVCLSNRAAAYLKLKQFDLAVADCSEAIEVAPTIKPFMRRAAAYIALREFGRAVDDLIAALEFEPRNKECRAKLQGAVETAVDKAQWVNATPDAECEDGNVYMLDISISKWFKVPIPIDQALAPRAWHSSVLTEAGKLFVLGGGTYHGPLKDAATLDLSYFMDKVSSL